MVSAKRGKAERSGIHAWHPYYAGYSESFVDSAISFLRCDATTLVLDPWCGSGTTNAVSSRRGIPSIGVDINPAMSTFAAAKSPIVLDHAEDILRFFSNLPLSVKSRASKPWKDDPLLEIFTPETARNIRSIIETVPFAASPDPENDSRMVLADIAMDRTRLIEPPYAFAISVIFVVIRNLVGGPKKSNPTWSKLSAEKQHLKSDVLMEALKVTSEKMLHDLDAFYSSLGIVVPSAIASADSRRLPIRDNTIDRLITSPPYLTRIDYAMSTQLELSLLADREALSFVRHNTMGAPVITKSKKEQNPLWGVTCNDILSRIKVHETKAASTYYWKNIVQYFSDAHAALVELHRVLKPDGQGLIVVQSSYFKEIEIPLGQIYVEMAENVGFKSSISFREEVKGHMAHVNTKSNAYMPGKVYFEDFVKIEK